MKLQSDGWDVTDCASNPLDLDATLSSGQAFRWRRDSVGIWWGAIGDVFAALWQAPNDASAPLYWRTFPQPHQRYVIEDYLRLETPLGELYAEWERAEPAIAEPIQKYRGLRILRQPPIECFFAFQCATCNTVIKIERTVYRLAERYGHPFDVPRIEPPCPPGENPDPQPATASTPNDMASSQDNLIRLYAFPTIDRLSDADERALRDDLWGYRAPRVIAMARRIGPSGPEWLQSLRSAPYLAAKSELIQFEGIGEKLADCICLFSLDKDEATPVDTHVRQIACRFFVPELAEKSLTPRVYAAIADAYRTRFGAYAGWAQQYLFHSEMRSRRR